MVDKRHTFKFHLLLPSWSLGEEENALPSISHAYSTDSILPNAISCQNSSSIYLAGRQAELEYLRTNPLFAIFSKSRNVYFLLTQTHKLCSVHDKHSSGAGQQINRPSAHEESKLVIRGPFSKTERLHSGSELQPTLFLHKYSANRYRSTYR